MKTKSLATAGLFLSLILTSSALHAATSFTFSNLNGVSQVNGEYIGPYTGTLGGLTVKLFCDDFNDDVQVPSTYNVNITAANSTDLSLTRFGTTNYNAAYPTGTTLYEEFAWLFTQMAATGQTTANQIAIQEAVWHMSSSTPAAVSTTSLANTGADKTYLQWIALAQVDYNKTVSGYLTPDFSRWMILTDVANASTKTVGAGSQELFAYYASGSVPATQTATPEPATWSMIGLGGLFIVFGRKRLNARR